jgi:RecA-family ATPase
MAVDIPVNGVANDRGEGAPLWEDEPHPYLTWREDERQADRERDAVREAPWVPLVTPAPVEWYTTPPPKRAWLLRDSRHAKSRGVLPLGKVGQMIAPGGVGKTMAVCQLAVAVATGTPWLGALSVATSGRVLLALAEEDKDECQRRLYRAARAARIIPAAGAIEVMPLVGVDVRMVESDRSGNFADTAFLVWLRERAKGGDYRLVVIDPLSRFAGKDAEKDNAAATRFIQACESLTSPTTTVLISHHTNQTSRKAGEIDGTAGRGVTGLVDGPRWQCGFAVERLRLDSAEDIGTEERERLGEIVTFMVTKSNYAVIPAPIVLRRDQENGGALVPMEKTQLQAFEQAREHDPTRAAKVAARETEREHAFTSRQRREAQQKRENEAARDADRAARKEVEDRALVKVLRAAPDAQLGRVELRSSLQAELDTLSHGEELVIVKRLGTAIERPGPPPGSTRDPRPFRLVEENLPEHLRRAPQ